MTVEPAAGSRTILVREAGVDDAATIWGLLEPVIRAGETYALPRDMSRDAAIDYWFAAGHEVFLAIDGDDVLATYFLSANRQGGGAHVANAGYITAARARGRGLARRLCLHSIERAKGQGFLAMQFNFVVATNESAVRLWQRLEFDIVGRLPKAFRHPDQGLVDALVMYRLL